MHPIPKFTTGFETSKSHCSPKIHNLKMRRCALSLYYVRYIITRASSHCLVKRDNNAIIDSHSFVKRYDRGNEVENPFTYISQVFHPSGSTNIWCRSLSANLFILSSIDGQYRGPNPWILPAYIGESSKPVFSTSCTSALVYVIQQQR